jgi:hypothetical protein
MELKGERMNWKIRTSALALILGTSLSLSAQVPNFTPATPLLGAAIRNDTAEVRRLLKSGANPNEGQLIGFSPVFFAVINHNIEMLRAFAEGGADLKATDASGSTILMWAAYDEAGRPDLVEELIRLGLDPSARNKNGETALTWALRRGPTPIVAKLRKLAPADESEKLKPAVEKSLALLQKSAIQFASGSGCASCHHQSLPQMATGLARERGFAVDEDSSRKTLQDVMNMMKPMKDVMLTETERIPDPAITVSYLLLGLSAEGYAADEITAAAAHLISKHQLADGSFRVFPARPPIESSQFTSTALSLRALQLYDKDSQSKVARAREWLQNAKPQTGEEYAMQLLGLGWAKADEKNIRAAAGALIARQRPDGGWGQLSSLDSDAYATGQALVALQWGGNMSTSDPVYRRGVDFLLRTQMSDGSWLVRSRSFPVQKYRESGFPHGKDQWISAAGSSWAVMALSLAKADPGKPASSSK